MITERTAAFGLLRDARTADGASARPWEYYHLLVAREDTTFTFAGTAGGGGGSNNDPGSRRVALTLVRGRAVDGNTNTVAHELGHNHGQGHVPACGADGDGNGFPYMNGALGVNGWSLSENALKSAAMFKELMGYCRPRWISDWMWGRFEARVRMVSATADGAARRDHAGRAIAAGLHRPGRAAQLGRGGRTAGRAGHRHAAAAATPAW